MKQNLLLTIFVFTLCITGCSSISKEDYDSKTNELENVQQELKNVQQDFNNAQKELETMQQELENVKTEYADYKKQNVEEELTKAGAKAWAETAFGKDAYISINDKDLYVNIPVGYTLSEKSITSLMNNIFSSLSLYTSYYKTNPEQLPYDSVTIIVLEEKTKLDMISMQFLRNPDDTFTKTATMINMADTTTILSYIDKALQ